MARIRRQQLDGPTRVVWIVAVILGALAILLHLHVLHIAALVHHDFLLLACGFILLAVAAVVRGL